MLLLTRCLRLGATVPYASTTFGVTRRRRPVTMGCDALHAVPLACPLATINMPR